MSEHTDPARDVEALAEHWHWDDDEVGAFRCGYVERREPCPIPERLYVFTPSELAADRARVRAETLAEVGRKVYDLPTTRTQAWRNGWNSVSLNDVLGIVRGMAEAGEQ